MSENKAIREARPSDFVVLGLVIATLGGLAYGGVTGAKEVVKQIQQESFPEFNADLPSKIISKKHDQGSGGGFGLFNAGKAGFVAVPRGGEGESYTFRVRQRVENGDGDKAFATTYAWVDKQTYKEYAAGDTVIPDEVAEGIKNYTWHDRIKEK